MTASLGDLSAFVAVARAGGFREAARVERVSASSLSETVRRLEARLGVRLLHRSTRSVRPTEAGALLLRQLEPALRDVAGALAALDELRERPAGTLRLNVPAVAARLVLPTLVPPFLRAYPDIRLEVVVEDGLVDMLAAGCDAGIRYEERLEQDTIAVPIGPRTQRLATAAAPDYLDRAGRPGHPRDLLGHACLRSRFDSGTMPSWEFERDGVVVRVDPGGPLLVQPGAAADLALAAAVGGLGIVHLFEDWLRPELLAGRLEPVLQPWWQVFGGPFLYFRGRRHLPPPLRAFVDFVRASSTLAARTVDAAGP